MTIKKKMRVGNNIRQRADGRFEARYEKGRGIDGKIIYGSCYGKTYEEAEQKRNSITGAVLPIKEMNLLILGAGEHGQEVKELAEGLRVFRRIAFLDDNKTDGVLGTCSNPETFIGDFGIAIPAVGDSILREKWMRHLIRTGFIIPTLVHPSAVVSQNAEIGTGSVICAGATIGTGSKLGMGCIIDSGVVVGRNKTFPDWTYLTASDSFK